MKKTIFCLLILWLCSPVFGQLYSGPFKADGSNLPPRAVTRNYYTATPVTLNATGAQNALNVVGSANIGSVLYVNKSAGRVGVGVSNPSSVFQTSGTSNISSLIYANFGTGYVGVGTSIPSSAFEVVGTSNIASLLYANAGTGRIGIGTSSPSVAFETVGTSNISSVLYVNSGTGFVGIGTSSPVNKLGVSGAVAIGSSYVGTAAPTNGAIIQGNVGIGTSSPNSNGRLTMQATGTSASGYTVPGNAALIIDAGTGTNQVLSLVGGGDLGISWANTNGAYDGIINYNASSRYMNFNTAATERIRITSTGLVGIGTTSPASKLGISGNLTLGTGYVGTAAPTNGLIVQGSVGIGTTAPNASAILDVQSTTLGLRVPVMTTTQKNAISSPAAGLIVYDTTLGKLCIYTTAWETISSI